MKSKRLETGGVGVISVALVCLAPLGCTAKDSEPGAGSGAVDASAETWSSKASESGNSENMETGPLFGGGVTTTVAATTTDSSTEATPNDPPIAACERAVADGSSPLIDDFDDGDQKTAKQDGRDGSWYFYDDGTAGTSHVNFARDETGEREGIVLSVTGSGFSDWGSGFGVGFNWNEGQCTYDASVYSGVQFWIRGTGETRLTLQNLSVRPVELGGACPADASCFDSHGSSFVIPEQWTLMRFQFSQLEQAGWGTPVGPLLTDAVYLMEFQFGVAQPFAIALDDVAFLRDAEPSDGGVSDADRSGSSDLDAGIEDASVADASANDDGSDAAAQSELATADSARESTDRTVPARDASSYEDARDAH